MEITEWIDWQINQLTTSTRACLMSYLLQTCVYTRVHKGAFFFFVYKQVTEWKTMNAHECKFIEFDSCFRETWTVCFQLQHFADAGDGEGVEMQLSFSTSEDMGMWIFLCIHWHSFVFLGIPWYSFVFPCIPRCAFVFLGIPDHSMPSLLCFCIP